MVPTTDFDVRKGMAAEDLFGIALLRPRPCISFFLPQSIPVGERNF